MKKKLTDPQIRFELNVLLGNGQLLCLENRVPNGNGALLQNETQLPEGLIDRHPTDHRSDVPHLPGTVFNVGFLMADELNQPPRVREVFIQECRSNLPPVEAPRWATAVRTFSGCSSRSVAVQFWAHMRRSGRLCAAIWP